MKSAVQSVTGMNINKALSQVRWINLILGALIIVVNIFNLIGNLLNPGVLLMDAFSILFAGILCLYEMQMKKLGQKMRRLYGFLYTYIGRAAYLFLYFLSLLVTD